MRVLIQSTISYLFLKDRNSATQDPEEARDFKQASRALRFVKQHRLTNVQIVLKFPKPSDDINLAILELLDREQRKVHSRVSKTLGNRFSKTPASSDASN